MAADRAALGYADEHEMLAYAGATLVAVEHALVGLLTSPGRRAGAESNGPMWCAAQALDVTALVWHRLRPSSGRRFAALGTQLQQLVDQEPAPQPSAALAAASARTAADALERTAVRVSPVKGALEMLEHAALALAAVAIQLWTHTVTPGGSTTPRALLGIDRAPAMRRHAARVVDAADAEMCAAPEEFNSVGDWLAVALARRSLTAALAVIDDPTSDRVLSAEASGVVQSAWISRGALELLALRCLAYESRALPRRHPRGAPHTVAAARAARCPATPVGMSNGRAWRAHSLALARTAATYLQAYATNDGWSGPTREELLSLLADSLAQASELGARFAGEDEGGSFALRT